jgi:hypothetical protein
MTPGPYRIEVDGVSGREWNAILCGFDDVHYEQADYGGHGNASRLVVRQDGEVVAGAQVAIYALPGLGRGLALVRFGPFWRRREQPACVEVYQRTIAAMIEEYCERRGHNLVMRPRPNPDFYAVESHELRKAGFAIRRPLPAPARYIADLSLDDAAMLDNFDQKWRYNLRQALKNDFDIRLCDTAQEVAVFRRLHDEMTVRKSLDSAARGMIDGLEELARLPHPIQMHVVLVRHEGRAIAGATVGILGDTALYVLGATDHTALKLKAGYAMQWWIMRWLHSQNVRWYELGGTGDTGIRQFKKGLIGKRGVVLQTEEYDRWTKTSARLASDVIYGIRSGRDLFREMLKRH